MAEETDANKHADAMSSGRHSVEEQGVGRVDRGWQGIYFEQDGMGDAQHFVGIPSAFASILPETFYLKVVAPHVAMGECLA